MPDKVWMHTCGVPACLGNVEVVRMSDDEGDSMCASEGEKKKAFIDGSYEATVQLQSL